MPAMIEACESLNIDERVTSMSIPLCCTCCRTGAVISVAVVSTFIIQYNNEEMHATRWIMLG